MRKVYREKLIATDKRLEKLEDAVEGRWFTDGLKKDVRGLSQSAEALAGQVAALAEYLKLEFRTLPYTTVAVKKGKS